MNVGTLRERVLQARHDWEHGEHDLYHVTDEPRNLRRLVIALEDLLDAHRIDHRDPG